jgi:hypothetical protein
MKDRDQNLLLPKHQSVGNTEKISPTLPWMMRHVIKAARLLLRQPGKVIGFACRHPKSFFLERERLTH